MTSPDEVVFLFDVDNTLLDNDRVQEDLRNHLEGEFGAESRDRYWAILEGLRNELGYTDYLGALQRYRLENLCDPSTVEHVLLSGGLSLCRPAVPGRFRGPRLCSSLGKDGYLVRRGCRFPASKSSTIGIMGSG